MDNTSDHDLSGALSDLVTHELVDRGALGEVLTKYLFLRAFDKAEPLSGDAEHLSGTMPSVTLESFLQSLQLNTREIGTYRPRNATKSNPCLGDYFKARLSLAQWMRCEDKDFGPDAAEEALLSLSALIAPGNCAEVDLMMVLALDDERVVDYNNLLVVFIQTKNRQQHTRVDISDRTLKPYRELGIPVIFIVHEVSPTLPWSWSARQQAPVS